MYVNNKNVNAGSVCSNQPAIVLYHDNNRTAAGVQITAVGKWQLFIPYRWDLKIRCSAGGGSGVRREERKSGNPKPRMKHEVKNEPQNRRISNIECRRMVSLRSVIFL
jgi:hypothetical protein